jgi:hypothetical protein
LLTFAGSSKQVIQNEIAGLCNAVADTFVRCEQSCTE